MIENAFHKLARVEDFEHIKRDGFKPSVPAEEHWLGEGIYFFLDPNGRYWARRWPCKKYNPRTDSDEGIIKTTVDTASALDLRDDDIRAKTHQAVNQLKLRLKFMSGAEEIPKNDGAAFALLFKLTIFKDIVEFQPTAILANFDKAYEQYRIPNSGVFLTVEKMIIGSTAQIQACVITPTIIGECCLQET